MKPFMCVLSRGGKSIVLELNSLLAATCEFWGTPRRADPTRAGAIHLGSDGYASRYHLCACRSKLPHSCTCEGRTKEGIVELTRLPFFAAHWQLLTDIVAFAPESQTRRATSSHHYSSSPPSPPQVRPSQLPRRRRCSFARHLLHSPAKTSVPELKRIGQGPLYSTTRLTTHLDYPSPAPFAPRRRTPAP